MSEQSLQLDLSQLAVDRGGAKAARLKTRRPWLTRYVVPLAIITGFIGLFGWAARESFLPAQAVTVTPVVVTKAEVKQEGAPLFQAAGWVEPRPTPVLASSLAPGVIRELHVVEGQRVKEGEPVATLIDTDAKLALAEAEARLEMQKGELARAEAALVAAQTNLERPVVLQAALADADALLAQTRRELENLPFAIEASETRRSLAAENFRRKESAGEAVTGRVLREARAELATANNAVETLVAKRPTLESQLESLQRKRAAIADQLSLLTEEKRAVADAKAMLTIIHSRVEQSRLAVEAAQLQLDRMTVRSPIDGCVLSLEARPGQWLSGMGMSSQQASNAVVGLYDPQRLQVRVDVRLEDVPLVQVGQPTQIATAALRDPIAGEVISVTTQADIQKNTLQVKVAVQDPPLLIKPEMLAKVTFVAPPSPVATEGPRDSPLRMFVPQSLVGSAEGTATVWVANLTTGLAERRTIEVGRGATEGGLVEVVSGLVPTDKLVVGGRDSLSDGMRVKVTGEDRSPGARWSPPGSGSAKTAQVADTNGYSK
ncbi:HlyD family efflux transporter periplasmic adaptor subunit [Botrimarina mediterranea]|uniref:Multidrug resistance protein MdtN n=1 Tax=Botrimarina mediterranea TaxID=2528022 RepID=A0A518K7C6_9BACT|nr:HlyD family efflux transporter periplasmic adaptor subunit [Botrimarina mediterranea]QDV73694.1 multidrug resistance protein MdtN [Botrimarina mediterranea]QDV78284.1 multidrug resistance protein MdtN [Planctomycetes bacterium K2D]